MENGGRGLKHKVASVNPIAFFYFLNLCKEYIEELCEAFCEALEKEGA